MLIKGGHGEGTESTDYLVGPNGTITLAAPRIATRNTHGTGCTYASAIAAFLAKGNGLAESVVQAKKFITTAIQKSFALGKGYGTLDQFSAAYNSLELH